MPKISTYTTVTPQGDDKIIVSQTSGTPTDVTKNVTVDGLKTFIKGIFPFLFNTTSLTGIQSTGNTASGVNSIAMGSGTTASGLVSTSMGGDTTASGTASTAMGNATTASGATSTAVGQSTVASGSRATAMGVETTASGASSTAIGESTTAFGRSSTSMGQFNILNTGDNATVYAATNTAFSIGNGTNSSSRSDAFKVLFNGTTTISGSITGTSIIKSGGASTEYLMADGSVTTGSGQVDSLTTTGTSGVSTLTSGVLNVPNYANTQNTLTTTGSGVATLTGTVLNIPTPNIPSVPFTSLTTTGTSGASTLISGVLNVPEYAGDANPLTYSTQLFQTGTNDPQKQALVVETLLAEGAGGFRRVTFTRSGVGDYRARVTYTLATNTTNLNIMFGDSICRVTNKVNGSDGTGSYREWSFETRDFNGTLSDGLLSGNNGGYMTITLYA